MQSINHINGERYDLPDSLNDSSSIDDFLHRNSKKPVVVVQGLGFVGAVMSLVCANSITEDYAVIGIDLPNENSYSSVTGKTKPILIPCATNSVIKSIPPQSFKKGVFNLIAP